MVLALSIASVTYGALLGTYILAGRWPRARGRDIIAATLVTIALMLVVVFAGRLRPGGLAGLARPGRPAGLALVRAARHRADASAWACFRACSRTGTRRRDERLHRGGRGRDQDARVLVGGRRPDLARATGAARRGPAGPRARRPPAGSPPRCAGPSPMPACCTATCSWWVPPVSGREPERGELREALRGERLADTDRGHRRSRYRARGGVRRRPGHRAWCRAPGASRWARTADGVVHRRGGYGWQMGDEGSGYAIGRTALSPSDARATAGVRDHA